MQLRGEVPSINGGHLTTLITYVSLAKNNKYIIPKQCTNTWQTTEVSNSTRQLADNSGNHADLWQKFAIAQSNGSTLLKTL